MKSITAVQASRATTSTTAQLPAMHPLALATVALFALVALPRPSVAQVAAEAEGPILEIAQDEITGDVSMSVMSIPVVINGNTIIHSPTNDDLGALLLDETPLPNRIAPDGTAIPGFIGGTAIVLGTSTNGTIVADDVFVEPAENVVLGELTMNPDAATLKNTIWTCPRELPPDPGDFAINGVPLYFLTAANTNGRMPFGGAIDPNGFLIDDYCLVTEGAAGVEGYYADGYLNIFALEAEATLPPGEDFVSIERAQCRANKGQLEVRGATTSETGTIVVSWNSESATTPIAPDGIGGGTYRLRTTVATVCPGAVMVEDLNTGATELATVDIR